MDRRVDRQRRDRFHDVSGDGVIYAHSADTDAQPGANMRIISATLITMSVTWSQAIEDMHYSATTAASRQACKQGFAAACGFARRSLLHVGVLGQHPQILLVLFPTYIPDMVIPEKDIPAIHGLAVALSLFGPTVYSRVREVFLPKTLLFVCWSACLCAECLHQKIGECFDCLSTYLLRWMRIHSDDFER
jgi:hypothetical protein